MAGSYASQHPGSSFERDMLGWPREIVRNIEFTMSQPGLFGLVLMSALIGGLAACLFGRPRAAFAGMIGAVVAGFAAPGMASVIGLTIRSIWELAAVMVLMALMAVAIWSLTRHRGAQSRQGGRSIP